LTDLSSVLHVMFLPSVGAPFKDNCPKRVLDAVGLLTPSEAFGSGV